MKILKNWDDFYEMAAFYIMIDIFIYIIVFYLCYFSINQLQKQNNWMSEFDQYLFSHPSNPKSPKISKYVVIDSDQEDFQQCQYALHVGQPKPLSQIQINRNINTTLMPQTGVSRSFSKIDEGMINRHLKNKKNMKNKIYQVKFDINKIQSQCQVLEQLIEKTIKQQAELQVRKHNLTRQGKRESFRETQRPSVSTRTGKQKQYSKTKSNQRQTPKQNERCKEKSRQGENQRQRQRARRTFSNIECIDISKTIKTFNSKLR